MMEELVAFVSGLDPFWVYVVVCAIAYIENIFPPFPSDFVVVAVGSMAGLGRVDFVTALIVTSTASTLGFLTMYKIGDWFGDKILESGRIPFLPLDQVHKVEAWFKRYGSWVVVANRFLAGTRAVVSFFVGIAELPLLKVTLLSFLSALVWNALLLYGGKQLGENWRSIFVYLKTYGEVITVVLLVVAGALLLRHFTRPKTGTPQ